MSITTRINLTQLKHKVMKCKEAGKHYIAIPIEDNNLFLSKKGNVFFDLYHHLMPEEKREHSDFIVFQSISKEAREKLEQENKQNPIIGNSSYFNNNREPEPNIDSSISNDIDNDDLPF